MLAKAAGVNPYPGVTREALTWHLGMLDGRNKRLHVVDER